MEQLIGFIIFALVAGLGQWLQNRASRKDEAEEADWDPLPRKQEPPRRGRQTPGRVIRWEDELKKQQHETNRPPLKPIILDRTRVPEIPTPRPPKLPSTVQREKSEGDVVLKSPLHTAGESQARAAALQAQISQRMEALKTGDLLHPVNLHPTKKQQIKPFHRSKEIKGAISFTKSPAGLRQAFIASVLLGPPKGIESVK